MILVFDLDDTVYDEISFVKSGYLAVSAYLENKYAIQRDFLFSLMMKRLSSKGRSNVFDHVLQHINHLSKKNIRECLSIYRLHKPDIHLNPEAVRCFERFKDHPLYIVTDGNKIVQSNKIKALGVDQYGIKAIPTHRYGLHSAKPSPSIFLKISKWENVSNDQIVYIGDNPNKDFVGIKPLGFKTIRIMKGAFKNISFSMYHEAHLKIKSLDELTVDLIKN